jgi:hypothetical protein
MLAGAGTCSRVAALTWANETMARWWRSGCIPGGQVVEDSMPASQDLSLELRLDQLPNWAITDKAAPAAPLARRQRGALPWLARPAHPGPHFSESTDQDG